jgi:hypothetical protein
LAKYTLAALRISIGPAQLGHLASQPRQFLFLAGRGPIGAFTAVGFALTDPVA